MRLVGQEQVCAQNGPKRPGLQAEKQQPHMLTVKHPCVGHVRLVFNCTNKDLNAPLVGTDFYHICGYSWSSVMKLSQSPENKQYVY